MDKATEIDMLKAEAADLEDALKQVQDRLTKLQDEK
jgi:predicted  nucleic acid-binding Zn-ribbon protein